MTITQPLLNEGQKMIYGRKRILDTFYKTHPVGKDIMEEDINGISFDDDYVLLHVENKNYVSKNPTLSETSGNIEPVLLATSIIESGDNDHLKVVSQKNIPYVLSIIVQMSIN